MKKKKKYNSDLRYSLLVHKKKFFLYKIYYTLIGFPLIYTHKKLLKYIGIGLIGTFVDFCILFVLTDVVGLFYLFSVVVSYTLGVTTNFFLNKKYTFKIKTNFQKTIQAYSSYYLVSLTSLVIILLFMSFFVELLKLHYLASYIIICLLMLYLRYKGHSFFFKKFEF
jgi:putative flippase GtrA